MDLNHNSAEEPAVSYERITNFVSLVDAMRLECDTLRRVTRGLSPEAERNVVSGIGDIDKRVISNGFNQLSPDLQGAVRRLCQGISYKDSLELASLMRGADLVGSGASGCAWVFSVGNYLRT